jgi:battenin
LYIFFEYSIQTAFAQYSLTSNEQNEFHYYFPLFNLCYQFGVFLSRSSLSLFQFPYITLLSFIQLLNFSFWIVQCFIHIVPFIGLIFCMIFVGLIGGASYANIFYMIINDDMLYHKEREIGVAWNLTFISVFKLLAVFFSYFADQKIFNSSVSL